MRPVGPALLLLALVAAGPACGRKGPPLPPLVRLPVPPSDLKVERRALTVDLTLTVPAANTDGTRPANISHVDVYALTGPSATTDAVILKSGTKIASVQVKAPRDPDQTVDVNDPDSDIEPPEGPGLDQGAIVHVTERLTPELMAARDVPPGGTDPTRASQPPPGPLVGAPLEAPSRLYLAVGLNARGRAGPVSKRVAVPLVPWPAAPPQPDVTYDERAITLTWPGVRADVAPTADGLLPSRPLTATPTSLAYYVYEAPSAGNAQPTRLTTTPVAASPYVDQRIEWGAERCYAVSAVETIGTLTIEGERGPSRCVTLADTFPPAPPAKPTAVAVEGGISLIWDPNGEKDLAGYLVLRATDAAGPFTALTPAPIEKTSYDDAVGPESRLFYAIEAVDKAGNVSARSEVVEETARSR